jgi:hypothetical protein
VRPPARRSDARIERAVRAARQAALPRAVTSARVEARALADGAAMTLANPIGVSRDAPPVGYDEPDVGRFGPGRWCGRIVTRRTLRRAGQPPRRVALAPRMPCAARAVGAGDDDVRRRVSSTAGRLYPPAAAQAS